MSSKDKKKIKVKRQKKIIDVDDIIKGHEKLFKAIGRL